MTKNVLLFCLIFSSVALAFQEQDADLMALLICVEARTPPVEGKATRAGAGFEMGQNNPLGQKLLDNQASERMLRASEARVTAREGWVKSCQQTLSRCFRAPSIPTEFLRTRYGAPWEKDPSWCDVTLSEKECKKSLKANIWNYASKEFKGQVLQKPECLKSEYDQDNLQRMKQTLKSGKVD